MVIALGLNQRRSLDILSDVFAGGLRLRIFAVTDDHSGEFARLIADPSVTGARVGRELDAAVF